MPHIKFSCDENRLRIASFRATNVTLFLFLKYLIDCYFRLASFHILKLLRQIVATILRNLAFTIAHKFSVGFRLGAFSLPNRCMKSICPSNSIHDLQYVIRSQIFFGKQVDHYNQLSYSSYCSRKSLYFSDSSFFCCFKIDDIFI